VQKAAARAAGKRFTWKKGAYAQSGDVSNLLPAKATANGGNKLILPRFNLRNINKVNLTDMLMKLSGTHTSSTKSLQRLL
jgi:hypothetical protein